MLTNRNRSLVFATLFVTFFAIQVRTQITPNPGIQQILTGAAEKRLAYIAEFKNLLSQETKSFETFDKKGEVKKRRSLISTFIVYPLTKKEGAVAEFRNVISVDGKTINDADKRAQDFFEDVAKAESSGKETEKIEKEASRYDEVISITGLTLYQAPVLADNLRPFFDFKLERSETREGVPVYVVAYQQIKDSPYVITSASQSPGDGKLALIYDLDLSDLGSVVPRLSGRLWIDAATFRIRRETRVLAVKSESLSREMTAIETSLDYQDSNFDILTPKRFVFVQYDLNKKRPEPRKDVAITFDYTNFTKPDVEVKSADIKN